MPRITHAMLCPFCGSRMQYAESSRYAEWTCIGVPCQGECTIPLAWLPLLSNEPIESQFKKRDPASGRFFTPVAAVSVMTVHEASAGNEDGVCETCLWCDENTDSDCNVSSDPKCDWCGHCLGNHGEAEEAGGSQNLPASYGP